MTVNVFSNNVPRTLCNPSYFFSALVSQASFRGETSGGVVKCGLFSQVSA